MEKKIYLEPKVDVYTFRIKSAMLAGSEIGGGDDNGDTESKSSGPNINWEGEDE